ncbi:hypothetical protein CEXT_28851 [Caerostris extrusa]|uniref:Uncharacterized protein n=1 Tax=Caerostris extrusa TaxID=172846 RepID=A0AAV4Y7B6_CAEEX|nr:hypothetical protein CEXT_28851 [Caerostris extrusa]
MLSSKDERVRFFFQQLRRARAISRQKNTLSQWLSVILRRYVPTFRTPGTLRAMNIYHFPKRLWRACFFNASMAPLLGSNRAERTLSRSLGKVTSFHFLELPAENFDSILRERKSRSAKKGVSGSVIERITG